MHHRAPLPELSLPELSVPTSVPTMVPTTLYTTVHTTAVPTTFVATTLTTTKLTTRQFTYVFSRESRRLLDYRGCYSYSLTPTNTDLQQTITANTVEFCKKECSNYRYYGLYSGTYCICRNSLPLRPFSNPNDCDRPCPGDSSQTCGGLTRITFFKRTLTGAGLSLFLLSVDISDTISLLTQSDFWTVGPKCVIFK